MDTKLKRFNRKIFINSLIKIQNKFKKLWFKNLSIITICFILLSYGKAIRAMLINELIGTIEGSCLS